MFKSFNASQKTSKARYCNNVVSQKIELFFKICVKSLIATEAFDEIVSCKWYIKYDIYC